MPSAALYARLSVDDKRQTSIPRQVDLCRQGAAQHGYTIEDHHIFIDDGYSGALLERPALERLMALVRARLIGGVFVADGDRLSREPAHDWILRQELKLFGATLYVGGQPVDESPEGEFKDSLLAVFAKYERLKTAQRMRQGKLRRAGLHQASGRPLACYVALGYRYVPDAPGAPAHFEIIEEEAGIVRRIYWLYLSGIGIWRIARILTEERIPTKMDRLGTRTVKKQRPVGVWSKSSVHKILRNQAYTGVMYWNKDEAIEPEPERRRKPRNLRSPKTAKRRRDESEWLPIAIPQIIDKETLDRAQAQIVKNAASNPRRRVHEYLFTHGTLRCGHCGFAMGGYLARGRRRYECRSHNDHLGVRCRRSVSADALEGRVWEVLEANILSHPENLHKYIEAKQCDANARRDEVTQWHQRIAQVGAELEALALKQQRLLDLYLAGTINQALFATNKATLDQSREHLETLRSELQARIDARGLEQSQVEAAIGFVQRLVDDLPRASIAERRQMLESLVVHVVYRDLDHMRIFLDIPLMEDPEYQDLQRFRWRGLESLQAIDWDDDIWSTRSG